MDHSTALNIAVAQSTLAASPIGHLIDYHPSLPTTMQPARMLAMDAAIPSGVLVTTEEQTQGRGRLERSWEAPFGRGLLSTTVLKTPHLPADAGQLPMIAGLAVVDALENVAPELAGVVWLKWPNDVLIVRGDETGKVAGILAESSYRGDAMLYALLGIGINVNQRRAELPPVPPDHPQPISLFTALGRDVDRTALLIELCRALAVHVDPTGIQRTLVHADWRARLHTLGRPVTVIRQTGADAGRITGVAVDALATGELIVEDETGLRHAFTAGDVSLRS